MTTHPTRSFGARAWLVLFLVVATIAPLPLAQGTQAADAPALPFAGDDVFLTEPLAVTDGSTATLTIDRAYGPLADAAGHLAPRLIGGPVAAQAALTLALDSDAAPSFAVSVNGTAVAGEWSPVAGERGLYRLAVPTETLLFPAPGDTATATAVALVPRANTLAFSGGAAALRWLRLTVPGAPPVLYMGGADTNCGTPGVQPVEESFGDWARWLAADGVPFVAPDRDGHLTIAEQQAFLDDGYARIVRAYGPNRPDSSPRITLVGYSMGGLVARQWTLAHPGVVATLVTVATPNLGTDAVTSVLARLAAGCAAGVLRDLTPAYATDFSTRNDLSTYWSPAAPRVVSVAAVPAQGTRTDGVVTEASALALTYATKIVWTPAPSVRTGVLHSAVMHAPQVYTDARAAAQFATPLLDTRGSR